MKYFKILLFLIPYIALAHLPDYTPLLKRPYFLIEINDLILKEFEECVQFQFYEEELDGKVRTTRERIPSYGTYTVVLSILRFLNRTSILMNHHEKELRKFSKLIFNYLDNLNVGELILKWI